MSTASRSTPHRKERHAGLKPSSTLHSGLQSVLDPESASDNQSVGEWLSLVEHLVRDQGVGGSNPLSPTIKSNNFN